jgi:hypothetical protein
MGIISFFCRHPRAAGSLIFKTGWKKPLVYTILADLLTGTWNQARADAALGNKK